MSTIYLTGQVTFADAKTTEGLLFQAGCVHMDYRMGVCHDNDFCVDFAIRDRTVYLCKTHTYNNDLYDSIFGRDAEKGSVAYVKRGHVKVGATLESAVEIQ